MVDLFDKIRSMSLLVLLGYRPPDPAGAKSLTPDTPDFQQLSAIVVQSCQIICSLGTVLSVHLADLLLDLLSQLYCLLHPSVGSSLHAWLSDFETCPVLAQLMQLLSASCLQIVGLTLVTADDRC